MSQCFAYAGGETLPAYPGLGQPVALLLVSFRAGKQEALPCSRETRSTFALLSDPGQTLALAVFSCFRFCSRLVNSESSVVKVLTRLYHTAFVITIYASCRHFYLLCKTRFRLMANLYRTGLVTCWVSSKGFKELHYPPFTGLSWRNNYSAL
jgi:hypothetical protein